MNTASTDPDSNKSKAVDPEVVSSPTSDPLVHVENTDGDGSAAASNSNVAESLPESSSAAISSTPKKHKVISEENTTSKQASAQAGSISNLIAIDAGNMESLLDFAAGK